MKRPKNLALVLFALAVLAAARADACCQFGYEICGTADSAGTITVQFNVNNCFPAGSFNVSPGQTALEVCNGLAAALAGQCPVTTPPNPDCAFTCYPSPSGCWVLTDDRECLNCSPSTFQDCCGITFQVFDTLAPLP